MIRFHFLLRPIDQIEPWDDGLHWFALTDGWYRIAVGDVQLLRYTPATARQYGMDAHPYVDYYAARLWEDVLQVIADVLQPVPAELLDFIATDRALWRHRIDDVEDHHPAVTAAIWHGRHNLHLGYLRQPPHVRMWRTVLTGAPGGSDTVTVAWSHRVDSDIRYTAPVHGSHEVPTAAFLTAVRQLDAELMAEMHGRVSRLERTGPPAGVPLDVPALRAEHVTRSGWLASRLRTPPEPADLAEVLAGVRYLGFL